MVRWCICMQSIHPLREGIFVLPVYLRCDDIRQLKHHMSYWPSTSTSIYSLRQFKKEPSVGANFPPTQAGETDKRCQRTLTRGMSIFMDLLPCFSCYKTSWVLPCSCISLWMLNKSVVRTSCLVLTPKFYLHVQWYIHEFMQSGSLNEIKVHIWPLYHKCPPALYCHFTCIQFIVQY